MFSHYNNDEDLYPAHLMERAKDPQYLGRMTDPTAGAYVKGPCGDAMEFYLVIRDNVIHEIKFYTEECIATRVCGSVTAQLARGKSVREALGISPKQVMEIFDDLPETHSHCSILAVSTLHRAIADYLLKP